MERRPPPRWSQRTVSGDLGGDSSGSRDENATLTRRSLLALGSVSLAGLAGCPAVDSGDPNPTTPTDSRAGPGGTPTPSSQTPTSTPTGLANEFDRVVDAVDDLGCDPQGNTACDSALETIASDNIGVRFPAGTYRFERQHVFDGSTRIGFVGVGDVTFVPPSGFNKKLLSFLGDWVRFEGIDIDIRQPETTAGLRFITESGFDVEDVTFRGRGTHPDDSVEDMLALGVRDPSARGTVRRVIALHGSAIGHYKGGNGRVGIWVGGQHRGQITVDACHFEEFGNNGIYASRTEGTLSVENSVFRNNNVCGVRLGGGGNVVRNTTIEVDLGRYSGPYTQTDRQYDTRAIVIEQGPYDLSGSVLVENCDLRILNADRSQGALVVWPTGNGPRIQNTRIETKVNWVPCIRAISPRSKVADDERAVDIIGTTISGRGSWGSAVELVDRPGASIENTTIEQIGRHRSGVRLVNSSPCRIAGSTVSTTEFPIFVKERGSPDGGCLVSLGVDTTLERTGPVLDALQTSEIAATLTDDTDDGDDGQRCIGTSILPNADSDEGVVITDFVDDTVSWMHHTPILPDRDR